MITKQLWIQASASYSFADYFRMNIPLDQLANYFGYEYTRDYYQLPHSTMPLTRLDDLLLRLQSNTLYTSPANEMARREFLIAPILTEVIIYTKSRIRVEFAITVNDQLKGSLDYLVQGKDQFLVIEAKNADLEQGFTQLAVELIALDKWLEDPVAIIYGAVTIGNIWQFGLLKRADKCIIQDMNLFRVPADMQELLQIMIAIVQSNDAC